MLTVLSRGRHDSKPFTCIISSLNPHNDNAVREAPMRVTIRQVRNLSSVVQLQWQTWHLSTGSLAPGPVCLPTLPHSLSRQKGTQGGNGQHQSGVGSDPTVTATWWGRKRSRPRGCLPPGGAWSERARSSSAGGGGLLRFLNEAAGASLPPG